MTDITISGMNELVEVIKAVEKECPYMMEEALEKAGKKFKSEVIKETHAATSSITGKLARGYRLGRVEQCESGIKIDFRATAPHFHLIENGHNKVRQKTRRGKKLKNGGVTTGFVPGRMIVAKVRADFQEKKFHETVDDELFRILKKGGLI